MSLFTYGIDLWGGTYYNKYVSQIVKFINRAYRNGYIPEKVNFREIIMDRDKKLWNKIINNENNALQELLLNKINRPLRQRGHEFELPYRCLFKFA